MTTVIERAAAWGRRAAPWLLLGSAYLLAGCAPMPVPVQPPRPVVQRPRSPLDGHPHLRLAIGAIDAQIAQLRAARAGDEGFGSHRRRAIALALQARAEIIRAALFADANP